jgi:hypothetical protein
VRGAVGGFPRDALVGALLADLGVELVPSVFVRDNPVQMRVVELAHVLGTFPRLDLLELRSSVG